MNCSNKPLLLASSSPFRQELLAKLGLPFSAASPDLDESPKPDETPEQLCQRLALEKAQALAPQYPGHLIIGSDQVALLEGIKLGKPGTQANAIKQLRAASGKAVSFYTSVCLLEPESGQFLLDMDLTVAHFRTLSDGQIEQYVKNDSPTQCAGGFKSESLGIALLEKLETEDPNALVGLPLIRLIRMLEKFGVAVL